MASDETAHVEPSADLQSETNSSQPTSSQSSGQNLCLQRKKRYSHSFRLKVIQHYKEGKKFHVTASYFKIDRKTVKEWVEKEDSIKQLAEKSSANRIRLPGAGRKPKFTEMEETLYKKIIAYRREKHFKVSRTMICRWAVEIWNNMPHEEGDQFLASHGWLENFFKRHKLVLRRRTTTGQHNVKDIAEKSTNFIMFVRQQRRDNGYDLKNIIAADEVGIWPDEADLTTVDTIGVKTVPIASTGHDKMRLTVMLSACANGTKLKPFVLLKRVRRIVELAPLEKDMHIIYMNTNWMNDETTAVYLDKVIGPQNALFKQKRLLIWDSFRSHISERTKIKLRQLGVHTAVIPGGCTSVIQKLSKELIAASFLQCGITNALDGSNDDAITMFKPGRKCEIARKLLKEKMDKQLVLNEHNLEEEASDSDDECVYLNESDDDVEL